MHEDEGCVLRLCLLGRRCLVILHALRYCSSGQAFISDLVCFGLQQHERQLYHHRLSVEGPQEGQKILEAETAKFGGRAPSAPTSEDLVSGAGVI